jgi:Zn-dependent protease with chaperone function
MHVGQLFFVYATPMKNHQALLFLTAAMWLLSACHSTKHQTLAGSYNLQKPIQKWLETRAQHIAKNQLVRVTLTNKNHVYAEINKDGTIHISSSFLLRIRDDAEITFVLAHEIAHWQLKHFKRRQGQKNWSAVHAEFEADRYATEILAREHLNPVAGATLLSALLAEQKLITNPSLAAQKTLQQRLTQLKKNTSSNPSLMHSSTVNSWRTICLPIWEIWHNSDPASRSPSRSALLRARSSE